MIGERARRRLRDIMKGRRSTPAEWLREAGV
jgi:hypothetical protein